MKRVLFWGLWFCCALALCLPADALSYVDNMSDLDNNEIKSYQNLAPIANSSVPAGVQSVIVGKNALTFANPGQPLAWAEYRVQGAETVTVRLYTQKGTFVAAAPGRDSYVLGVYQKDMSHLSSQQPAQALLSRSTGEIYARIGGQLYKVQDTTLLWELRTTSDGPEDLLDYGINLYAGSDAGSMVQVSLQQGQSQTRTGKLQYDLTLGYACEELTYSLPSGTRIVRVEINDYTLISSVGANGAVVKHPAATGMRTILDQVTFTGNSLVLGNPQPDKSESVSSASSSSAENASSSKKSTSSSSRASSAASSSSSKASSGGSAKFQGEVTSTVSGGSRAAQKSSRESGDNQDAQEQQLPALEPPGEEQSTSRAEIFYVPPERGRSGKGVYLYIVVTCGLIAILLLWGKSGGKKG